MIEHKYHAVPGTNRPLSGVMADSIPGIISALKTHQMVSDAGLYGSVIVYREDQDFCCLFMANGATIDQTLCKHESELTEWLNAWMPRQHLIE